MDWKKIKEKYPKAFNKLKMWSQVPKSYPLPDLICDRNLYDFFDDNDIIINVSHNTFQAMFSNLYPVFNYYIIGTFRNMFPEKFINRRLAEKAAFEKAFEILNNKLNGTNN